MFSDSFERRLRQQCSPASRKQSVLVRPEPMDRFVPCRLEQNWQTNFQGKLPGIYVLILVYFMDSGVTVQKSMLIKVDLKCFANLRTY